MDFSYLYDRLKEDCGFVKVDSHPTGDDYGAMTVVQLTDEQFFAWNQLDNFEIKNRILTSENYVRMALLKGQYYLKTPEVWVDGRNMICFHGSKLVAAVFFRIIFPKQGDLGNNLFPQVQW